MRIPAVQSCLSNLQKPMALLPHKRLGARQVSPAASRFPERISPPHRSLTFIILLGLGLFAPWETHADVSDPAKCDAYAASDIENPGIGVSVTSIIVAKAVPACEAAVQRFPNDPRLHFQLGRAYLAQHNFGSALREFQAAVAQSYPPAFAAVGGMYSTGEGVSHNDIEAFGWFKKAAELGSLTGAINLALSYENGLGVKRDYGQAFHWYRTAADRGSPFAEGSVGFFYSQGWGVNRDDAEAVKWLQAAAIQGMPEAQYNLGTMYEHGLGVEKNLPMALGWYQRAAAQDFGRAKDKVAKLLAETSKQSSTWSQTNVAPPAGTKTVRARGVSVVPGAIVCPDLATVQVMFHLYIAHWEESEQDAVTRGQSVLLRGPAEPLPDLALYGCALIPTGKPMQLEPGNVVPVVTASGPDGAQIRGVTLPNMVGQ